MQTGQGLVEGGMAQIAPEGLDQEPEEEHRRQRPDAVLPQAAPSHRTLEVAHQDHSMAAGHLVPNEGHWGRRPLYLASTDPKARWGICA